MSVRDQIGEIKWKNKFLRGMRKVIIKRDEKAEYDFPAFLNAINIPT